MASPVKHRKYMEDDFDLDDFILTQQKNVFARMFKIRNQKVVNVLTVLIIILAFVIAWLGYTVVSYYIELWQNHKINQQAMLTVSQQRELPAPTSSVRRAAAVGATSTPTPTPVRERIAALQEIFENDDIIGYLELPDTNINFPVVLGADNNFYLTHDLYKADNVAGSAFMDDNNRIDPLGYNTVIYAHNMRNGSMFHDLRYYSDPQFYETHKMILLETLYEETQWEIFSYYVSDKDFDYIQTRFMDSDDFYDRLLALVLEKSEYDMGVEVAKDDQVLTLSTCTNRIDDSRYVVHAKRIRQENVELSGNLDTKK